MKTMKQDIQKRVYSTPQLERVVLDNEISLILQSVIPPGPGDEGRNTPSHFNNDPFKTNMA
jgi:hypothetical protein